MARRTRAELKTKYLVCRVRSGSQRERDPAPEDRRDPRKSGDRIRNEPGENLWARTEIPQGDKARKVQANQLSRKGLVRHVNTHKEEHLRNKEGSHHTREEGRLVARSTGGTTDRAGITFRIEPPNCSEEDRLRFDSVPPQRALPNGPDL